MTASPAMIERNKRELGCSVLSVALSASKKGLAEIG